MGGWGDFKVQTTYTICSIRLLEERKGIKWCTNLWNLLCMAKNIFEDPTKVGKENCKIRTEDYHKEFQPMKDW